MFSNHPDGANDDPCDVCAVRNRSAAEMNVRAALLQHSLPGPAEHVIVIPIALPQSAGCFGGDRNTERQFHRAMKRR